jgi:Transmembrane protein 254
MMQNKDSMKKVFIAISVMHTFEAMIAYRAAKKRGKNPKLYCLLTQFLGVFILVPLLRKPKVEQ